MKRRRVLALAAGTVPLTGGCLGQFRPGPEIYIPRVVMVNHDEDPHTLEFELSQGDRVVFEGTVDVEAAESDGDGGVDSGQRVVEASWPQEPAVHTARTRMDGEGDWQEQTVGNAGYEPCVEMRVVVDRSGDERIISGELPADDEGCRG